MKKGLSCESTYDAAGNWMLIVRKERGKLSRWRIYVKLHKNTKKIIMR